MMSRFGAESNSWAAYEGVALKIYSDGADAVLDSATILARTSHADEQRILPPQFQKSLSYRRSRGRMLDYRRRWPPLSRRFRAGCGRQHRPRRGGTRARDG